VLLHSDLPEFSDEVAAEAARASRSSLVELVRINCFATQKSNSWLKAGAMQSAPASETVALAQAAVSWNEPRR
jgi:hypothetical protein